MLSFLSTYWIWIWIAIIGAMLVMHSGHSGHGGKGGGCGGGHGSRDQDNSHAQDHGQHDHGQHDHGPHDRGQRDGAARTRGDAPVISLSKTPPTSTAQATRWPDVQHAPE